MKHLHRIASAILTGIMLATCIPAMATEMAPTATASSYEAKDMVIRTRTKYYDLSKLYIAPWEEDKAFYPLLIDGTTYLPLETVQHLIGVACTWQEEGNILTLGNRADKVDMTLYQTLAEEEAVRERDSWNAKHGELWKEMQTPLAIEARDGPAPVLDAVEINQLEYVTVYDQYILFQYQTSFQAEEPAKMEKLASYHSEVLPVTDREGWYGEGCPRYLVCTLTEEPAVVGIFRNELSPENGTATFYRELSSWLAQVQDGDGGYGLHMVATQEGIHTDGPLVKVGDTIYVLFDATGQSVNAILFGGRIFLPIRGICGLLGLSVDWNAENKSITIGRNFIHSPFVPLYRENAEKYVAEYMTELEEQLNQARTKYPEAAEIQGITEDFSFTDSKIDFFQYLTQYGNNTLFRFHCSFLADKPEQVFLAGGSSITEDGWFRENRRLDILVFDHAGEVVGSYWSDIGMYREDKLFWRELDTWLAEKWAWRLIPEVTPTESIPDIFPGDTMASYTYFREVPEMAVVQKAGKIS